MPSPFPIVQPALRRPYSQLSEAEKWDWHADLYAFRRVHLGIEDDVRISPCDPEGTWFDEPRVELATKRRRDHIEADKRARDARYRERQLEGRALLNEWAQARGYSNIDAYATAEHEGNWFGAYNMALASMTAASQTARRPGHRYQSSASALGVTAREYTPEEMSASRQQLGIEE